MNRNAAVYLQLALLALVTGVLVYFLARSAEPVLLTQTGPQAWIVGSAWLAPLNGQLPDFLHTYAFILLTFVALGVADLRHLYISIFLWLVIETLFELGQHPAFANFFSRLITDNSQPGGPLLALNNFFSNGTFDGRDIVAILMAGAAARLSFHLVQHSDATHETDRESRRSNGTVRRSGHTNNRIRGH